MVYSFPFSTIFLPPHILIIHHYGVKCCHRSVTLDTYEQLHIDEMAELRQEIERLRRAFLQETNPKMYILAPERDLL